MVDVAPQDMKRSIKGYRAGVCGVDAQAWQTITTEVSKFANGGKLNKEGISSNIPNFCRVEVAKTLNVMGNSLKKITTDNEILFDDEIRNEIFSKDLSQVLGYDNNVFFEE